MDKTGSEIKTKETFEFLSMDKKIQDKEIENFLRESI